MKIGTDAAAGTAAGAAAATAGICTIHVVAKMKAV